MLAENRTDFSGRKIAGLEGQALLFRRWLVGNELLTRKAMCKIDLLRVRESSNLRIRDFCAYLWLLHQVIYIRTWCRQSHKCREKAGVDG